MSGYQIHSLSKDISELERENKQFTAEVARYSSMSSINERLPQAHMKDAGKVYFVSIDDAMTVAQR